MLRFLWLFALLLATLSHSTEARAADGAAQQQRARRFVDHGMGTTLAACNLPRTCGHRAPVHATKQLRETGNDARIDQRHVTFDGLDVEFLYVLGWYGAPAISRAQAYRLPYVLELTVTSSAWPVAQGLRVGTKRADVHKVLGDNGATPSHDGSPEPDCDSYVNVETQNEARLCYDRGRLASIKWVMWWDG
ncbi:MAG: hypothetical protein ABJD97_01980 [Betaproteobacteria bacterium]